SNSDGYGDSRNIAQANRAGQGGGQGLKMANLSFFAFVPDGVRNILLLNIIHSGLFNLVVFSSDGIDGKGKSGDSGEAKIKCKEECATNQQNKYKGYVNAANRNRIQDQRFPKIRYRLKGPVDPFTEAGPVLSCLGETEHW